MGETRATGIILLFGVFRHDAEQTTFYGFQPRACISILVGVLIARQMKKIKNGRPPLMSLERSARTQRSCSLKEGTSRAARPVLKSQFFWVNSHIRLHFQKRSSAVRQDQFTACVCSALLACCR